MQGPGETTMNKHAAEQRSARARHRGEMLILIRGLARRHKNLVNRISKAEMNAGFIEYELFQLLKMMEEYLVDDFEGFDGAAVAGPTTETPGKDERRLRYLAGSGTSLLEIKTRPDGMADLRIDGGKQFTLPPTLADLLTALSI